MITQKRLIKLIFELLENGVKGQIQIDFCGNGQDARVKFTDISMEEVDKLKEFIENNELCK